MSRHPPPPPPTHTHTHPPSPQKSVTKMTLCLSFCLLMDYFTGNYISKGLLHLWMLFSLIFLSVRLPVCLSRSLSLSFSLSLFLACSLFLSLSLALSLSLSLSLSRQCIRPVTYGKVDRRWSKPKYMWVQCRRALFWGIFFLDFR